MSGGLAAAAVDLAGCGSNTGRPAPASSSSGGSASKPQLSQCYHEYGEDGEDGVQEYFMGFPKELEEAAYIDGAGYWRTFWSVVMPNTYGICAAVGTIVFIGSWNAFLWPLLIGQDRDFRTVQVALSQFMSSPRINMPQLFVGATVAIIPVL